MVSPTRNDDEEKPLDPAVENVRRKLLRFMLINLGILGVALIAVVAAIVYKSRTTVEPAPAPATAGLQVPNGSDPVEGSIPLPSGARIVSQSLSGDRISLYVEEAGGARAVFLYDLAQARMIGRFAIRDGN